MRYKQIFGRKLSWILIDSFVWRPVVKRQDIKSFTPLGIRATKVRYN